MEQRAKMLNQMKLGKMATPQSIVDRIHRTSRAGSHLETVTNLARMMNRNIRGLENDILNETNGKPAKDFTVTVEVEEPEDDAVNVDADNYQTNTENETNDIENDQTNTENESRDTENDQTSAENITDDSENDQTNAENGKEDLAKSKPLVQLFIFCSSFLTEKEASALLYLSNNVYQIVLCCIWYSSIWTYF